MILSYKQQRTEENLELFISQIMERQDEFNNCLSRLEPDKLQMITNHYFGVVTDYVLNVKQKEKIQFLVNGYVNLADWEDINEDVVFMFYDVLEQLALLDIAVLKSCLRAYAADSANQEMLDKLMPGQKRLIHEKLVRLGLLESQSEKSMDENVKNIASYLQDVQKGKKNAKLKLKKIWESGSYPLTTFGKEFLQFFLNEYQPDIKAP